ncbi:MAG: InlB B-repeat-containing protein [Clostridia bacterium]|nr:InlB B-repeat-containing protein [Clostridia bacterium]
MKVKGLFTTAISTALVSVCVLASCSKTIEYPVQVSFDLNFETSEAAPNSITLNMGEEYGELPTVTAENEGYHFAGWNTRADGEGREITEETTVNATMGNHTLYAMWEGNEYEVSFDLNGGDINGVTQISSKTATYGEMYGSFVLPSDPAKDMHKFKGWYLNPEGTGDAIDVSSMVRTAKDHTLYAVFKELKFYYDFSNPEDIEDFFCYTGGLDYSIQEGQKEDGSTYNYLEIANRGNVPTGNMVLDMNLTAGTKITLDVEFDGEVDPVELDDRELEEKKVKAGFFCYGANADGSNISSGSLGTPGAAGTPDYVNKWYWGQGARNDPWEASIWNDGHMNLTVNILENCYGLNMYLEFGRRSISNTDLNSPDYDTDASLWINNKWRINSITIDYVIPPQDLPDGTDVNVNFDWNYETDIPAPESIAAVTGQEIGDLPEAHEREGCEFAGWNTSPDGKGKSYYADRLVSSTEENITLYAIWEGYEYNLSFDLQGGNVGGSTTWSDEFVTFAEAYGNALPEVAPTKAGASFGGWFLNPEGTGTPITSTSVVNVVGDHTLYAVFIADVNTVNVFDFSNPTNALYVKNLSGLSLAYASEDGGYLEISNTSAEPYGHVVLMKNLKAGTTVDVDLEFLGEVDYDDGVKAGAFFYGAKEDGWGVDVYNLGIPGDAGTPDEVNKWYWGQGARNDPWEAAVWNNGQILFSFNILEDVYGLNIMLEFGKKTVDGATVLDKSLWENNKWRVNSITFNTVGEETEYAFDLQGGNVDGATTLDSVKTVTGAKYGTLPTPEKDGFEFIGWYLNADGNGTAVTADSVVKNNQAHTLYAIWKELRNVYDFTTQEQLADFRDLNGNGVLSLVPDDNGSYLKIASSDATLPNINFVLQNMFLKTGTTVAFSVEFVGSYDSDNRAGIFAYGANADGSNITSGTLGTPGEAGTSDEVNKWYWGQGYHSNDAASAWNNGKYTYTANILEDCYGVYFWAQLGSDATNGYWKITEIRINRA